MLKLVGVFCVTLVSLAVFVVGVSWLAVQAYSIYTTRFCEARRPKAGQPFESGRAIIQALEEYKQENGIYPTDLQSLTPDYLTRVPKPNWGCDDWDYIRTERGFALSVRRYEHDYVAHIYENGSWWYDQ